MGLFKWLKRCLTVPSWNIRFKYIPAYPLIGNSELYKSEWRTVFLLTHKNFCQFLLQYCFKWIKSCQNCYLNNAVCLKTWHIKYKIVRSRGWATSKINKNKSCWCAYDSTIKRIGLLYNKIFAKYHNGQLQLLECNWLELPNSETLPVWVAKQTNLYYFSRGIKGQKAKCFWFWRKQSLCRVFRRTPLNG